MDKARCLNRLARLFYRDEQLESHRILGDVYRSEGRKEKAIHHLGVALGIASPSNWHDQLFWIHYSLAALFLDKREFDGAHSHVERAKSLAAEDAYNLGRAMGLLARILCRQCKFKEAKFEALRAYETFEKLEATRDLEVCRTSLQEIERATKSPSTRDNSNFYGELPE